VIVSVQNPLQIDEYSIPQPDIALWKLPFENYADRLPGPPDVLLVIEVADSSIQYDRKTKTKLYGAAGITDYWIVNLAERQIEVYIGDAEIEPGAGDIGAKAGEGFPGCAGLVDAALALGEAGEIVMGVGVAGIAADEILDVVRLARELIRSGETGLYEKLIARVDRAVLAEVLRQTRGNQVRASELLGIARNTLRSKLRAAGLAVEKQVGSDQDQDGQ